MVRAPQQKLDVLSLRSLLGTATPPRAASLEHQVEAWQHVDGETSGDTDVTELTSATTALQLGRSASPGEASSSASTSSRSTTPRRPRAPPAYGSRRGFRPSTVDDYGDGGAFPELLVLQYPLEMARGLPGPGGAPVDLDLDYEKLQLMASKALLKEPLSSPEYASFRRFMQRHAQDVLAAFPTAASVARVTAFDPADVEARCLQGEGSPLIFSDGMRDWDARKRWTLDYLTKRFGSDAIVANDRAPARRVDGVVDRAQRSVHMPLGEFLRYLKERTVEARHGLPETVPFYLNGWRAYSSHSELFDDAPPPYFTEAVDHTRLILQQVDVAVFKGAAASDPAGKPWWDGIDQNLSKLFMGPAGTITRLHFDCGDAHAWLGQVKGRKLFVCFSPSDTKNLYQMESEVETSQSPIDPLEPDLAQFPDYAKARPYVFVLHPGEIVLVPKGWWHYAVSLDESITSMRNWYHAPSNGPDFVQFVMRQIRRTKQEADELKQARRATASASQ